MEAAHLIAQVQQLEDLLLTRQGESELLADACDAHDNLRTVKGTSLIRIIRPELGAGECTAGRLVGDQALGPTQARELGSAELLRGLGCHVHTCLGELEAEAGLQVDCTSRRL